MKIKILLFLNILQMMGLIFILDRVGYLEFENQNNWENSFMYSSVYKDKTKLFQQYAKMNKYNKPIIFLGDSITEKMDWQELFSSNNIINRGICSDTISGVINRLDSILQVKPSKVFLMIGINDMALGKYQ
jgi:hypothetical protein